jgi:hypothetical protein
MRHRRAPSRRRKPHRRPIVADAIKDRIVHLQRLHLLPQLPRRRHRRLRANGVSNARHNPRKPRRLRLLPQLPRRRHRRLRADYGSNGLSVHRNRRQLRRLRLLLRLQRRRHRRLRANNVRNGLSVHRNRRKLRRLHKLRHRHRRLRVNNGGNGLSVRRKLRRLHPLRHRHRRLRVNNGGNGPSVRRKLRRLPRLPLRQRLWQNRPIPIRTKNRTATGKTIGPVRPDPVHRIGCAIFEQENSDLSLGSSRCAVRRRRSALWKRHKGRVQRIWLMSAFDPKPLLRLIAMGNQPLAARSF